MEAMASDDLSQLELRYINSCKEQEVLPSYPILSSFSKVKHKKFRILEIFVDQLICSDIPPLVDAFSSGSLSDVDAIDVCQRSSNPSLTGDSVVSLLHALKPKLRVVDLIDWSFWTNILQDICHRGLACRILNLRFSPIQELNMTGKFMQLHTLNLDSSIHLTSFQIDCFSRMPKLMQLSLCATRVSNLWTTTAALSKLPSLVELRFQSCLCCYGTGPCPKSGGGSITPYKKSRFGQQQRYTDARPLSFANENFLLEKLQYITGETPGDMYSDGDSYTNHELLQTPSEESSDDGETYFSSYRPPIGNWEETLHNATLEFDEHTDVSPFEHNMLVPGSSSVQSSYQFIEEIAYSSRGMNNGIPEVDELEGLNNSNSNNINGHAPVAEFSSHFSFSTHYTSSKFTNENHEGSSVNMLDSEDTTGTTEFAPERPTPHHPSPICFEKYYREYMISSLTRLKVLDNLPIKDLEKEKANETFKKYYEHTPYNRNFKECVLSILQKREVGTSTVSYKHPHSNQPYFGGSHHSYARSLAAAKVSSSPWPHLHPISKFRSPMEGIEIFRPRQFEYHPSNPSLMVFGTLNGEIVVINHESQKLVGYHPSLGTLHSILGLCWLKKYQSKLIAGSDNGSLQLYDTSKMPSTVTDRHSSLDACLHSFDEFEQLTSVHINSTDDYFLASGFSKHVALYDIGSGRRLQFLKDLHQEHINVVKFSHHSPSIFATASFDQNVRMWDLRQGTSQPCYTTCSSRGNVMVCFSPDDHYLLASAIDNEVKHGLHDHLVLLNVIVGKIATNLKRYTECEEVIEHTLSLFLELASGYMTGKLLLKLDAIKFIIGHHTRENFPFLEEYRCSRSRTTFYYTLGYLIFMEDSPVTVKFKSSMDPLLQVMIKLESTPDTAFRTDAVKYAFIGLMRDLRGIAMATNSRRTYGLLFDWLYPSHMPLLLKAISHWTDVPEVTTPLLKFIAEFVLNKAQRLTFDSSSPNGILLFREVSKIIVAYGSRILSLPNITDLYANKYKGIWISLTILQRALGGNYVNFGVFELYGDRAFADALDISLKMTLAIPLADILSYRKLTKAYFGFVDILFNNHISFILNLDTNTFMHIVGSLEAGLKGLDTAISSQCASSVDNLAAFYFNNITIGESPPSASAVNLARHVVECPNLFPEILRTLFEIVLFEDCGNQWSLSRPMLSLILISEQIFSDLKAQILASQPLDQQQRLLLCFDKLMADVTRSLDSKNRDKFTQNLTVFRHEFRAK